MACSPDQNRKTQAVRVSTTFVECMFGQKCNTTRWQCDKEQKVKVDGDLIGGIRQVLKLLCRQTQRTLGWFVCQNTKRKVHVNY